MGKKLEPSENEKELLKSLIMTIDSYISWLQLITVVKCEHVGSGDIRAARNNAKMLEKVKKECLDRL